MENWAEEHTNKSPEKTDGSKLQPTECVLSHWTELRLQCATLVGSDFRAWNLV